MQLKKGQGPILILNGIGLLVFSAIFLSRRNYEFMGYIGVIVAALLLILLTNHRVDYPNSLLWGLTLWSFLHMSGGGILVAGSKLYGLMLLRIVGEPYNILRYDQLVHIIGFGVATILMFTLINPVLKRGHKWPAVSIVVIMAGLGVGAVNEIIEFMVTVLIPGSGVGGYINNALDLLADVIGAMLAMVYIYFSRR